jgi:hypothetical protein
MKSYKHSNLILLFSEWIWNNVLQVLLMIPIAFFMLLVAFWWQILLSISLFILLLYWSFNIIMFF